MNHKKIAERSLWFACINELLVLTCWCFTTVPSESSTHADTNNAAVNKFQSALQQQNTVTILGSIEERLRNLDNVYSMQLSLNFETKLEQYNRKLENLDGKITRLEALVMLNLEKLSENISTRNFRDDLMKTSTLRKLDSIYEGITHRIDYIEKKFDTNYENIQEKVQSATIKLDKLDTDATKRNSDLETEISTAILGIKDLKTVYSKAEKQFSNFTQENSVISKHTHSLLTKYNTENRKSLNKLHDNIIGNLQYIDNKTNEHQKISDDTNKLLKQMKVELKEDFNNYANKVADMNSDMWRSTDTTEDDLKNIASSINGTKVELQNGIRSLMVQIGKVIRKDDDFSTTDMDYKELEKVLTANFERILTNQDVFLESCHRLQMDESQIESEISVMLNKLIDMLEKKLASETRDIKNFEKNLRIHDSKINRNVMIINQNVNSLSEKFTDNTQIFIDEIKKIGGDLKVLFPFVQKTTDDGFHSNSKAMMDKLNLIDKSTRDIQFTLNSQIPENTSNHQIFKEIQQLSRSVLMGIVKLQNYTKDFHEEEKDMVQNLEKTIKLHTQNCTSLNNRENNQPIQEAIENVFGNSTNNNDQKLKRKCKQNIRNLIDIRADADCEETQKVTQKPKRKKKYDIDIRADVESNDDYEDMTNINEQITSTTEGISTTTVIDQNS